MANQLNRRTDKQPNDWLIGQIKGCTVKQIDSRLNVRQNSQTNGWLNGQIV